MCPRQRVCWPAGRLCSPQAARSSDIPLPHSTMEALALSLAALTGLAGAIPTIQTHADTSDSDWRSKITNVVVLVEENRSFDTFAGGLTYNSTIDGLLHHNYCNALNASNPNGKCLRNAARPTPSTLTLSLASRLSMLPCLLHGAPNANAQPLHRGCRYLCRAVGCGCGQ